MIERVVAIDRRDPRHDLLDIFDLDLRALIHSGPLLSLPTQAAPPGGLGPETEILIGVLEATVRDPCGRAPATKLTPGLEDPGKLRRQQAAPTPVFTPARRPAGIWELTRKSMLS